MNIEQKKAGGYCTLLFVWGFCISLPLLSAYSGGDQIHYTAYYSEIGEQSLRDAYQLQPHYLGSSDLIYPAVAWLGSHLNIDKGLYFSFWNAILVSTIGATLIRNRASALFILLTLTNFYLLVLLTGAERLKFSYLLLALATIAPHGSRIVIVTAAVFAHFQSAINAASLLAWKVTRRFRFTYTKSQYFGLFAATIFCLTCATLFFHYFGRPFLEKVSTYSSTSRGVTELYQIALLSVAGAISLKRKARFLSSMLVVGAFAFFLGGERVNMIGAINLLYFAVREERTRNPLILTLMLFFTIKSVPFLISVYQNGHGFETISLG